MKKIKLGKAFANVRCYTQKLFMDKHGKTHQQSERQQQPEPQEQNPDNAISLSMGVPLAAKDSEWIGLKTQLPLGESKAAVECLFPGVNFTDAQSTTVITKLLMGKKADLSALPSKPERLMKSNPLTAVVEHSKEELLSDADISYVGIYHDHVTGSDVENYDDDDEDEPKRAMHTKRRKRRSDVKMLSEDATSSSSLSLIPTVRRKSGSRIRSSDGSKSKPVTPNKMRTESVISNDADDEYMTHSSHEKCDTPPWLPPPKQ